MGQEHEGDQDHRPVVALVGDVHCDQRGRDHDALRDHHGGGDETRSVGLTFGERGKSVERHDRGIAEMEYSERQRQHEQWLVLEQ